MGISITWLGHASFELEYDGYKVVIDPFKDGYVPGFAFESRRANKVLCTHQHTDHNYRQGVELIEGMEDPFDIKVVKSWHDDKQGKLRGANDIYVLTAGGKRVCHMGDVGQMPEDIDAIKGVDVLLIPVGGVYTVDGQGAKEIVDAVKPKTVIPMHYRGEGFGFENLATVKEFTDLFEKVTEMDCCRVDVDRLVAGVVVLKRQ